MFGVFFVLVVVEELYNPVNCFSFHVEETNVLTMSLEHGRSLIDFDVVLWFCKFSQKEKAFGLLHGSSDTGEHFLYFISLIKHRFDKLIIFAYSALINFFAL